MKIDVTEEEREFLERVCKRSELFCQMGLIGKRNYISDFTKDLEKIRILKSKFIELDANRLGRHDN